MTAVEDDVTWHGTTGGYSNHGCRCPQCRKAWAAYCRKRKRERTPENAPHGTTNGYHNYRCRCDRCRAAWAAASRDLASRQRASLPE